jgi:hypothetical protein
MAAGRRSLLLGPNQYMDSYNDSMMTAVSNWISQDPAKLAREWAGRGVNCVAIPTNNNRSSAYMRRLQAFTDALASVGIRSILRPFGGVTWAPSASNGQLNVDHWNALGRPLHVLLDTVNEPNRITNDVWRNGTLAEIDVIRSAGYTQPIFCDGQGWAWQLPLSDARAVEAVDDQVVFMSHRYAFTGSGYLDRTDPARWAAEWGAAPDLAVGVGEYGWFNGQGNPASINEWCAPIAAEHIKAVRAGWLSVVHSWMWLWDQNSHIVATGPPPSEPQSSNRDWYAISRGAPWTLNAFGTVVTNQWQVLAAEAAALAAA